MAASNFFQTVTVSSSTFSDSADVVSALSKKRSFTLINEGTGVIEYSFDGSTLHGNLTPGTNTEALSFDNRRVSSIWFRLKSGAASDVRVEMWNSF